jgi:hypothetical protein
VYGPIFGMALLLGFSGIISSLIVSSLIDDTNIEEVYDLSGGKRGKHPS